ncbi:hypothetical protein ADL26_20910, partial [Thermoactinomyces vulgaris]
QVVHEVRESGRGEPGLEHARVALAAPGERGDERVAAVAHEGGDQQEQSGGERDEPPREEFGGEEVAAAHEAVADEHGGRGGGDELDRDVGDDREHEARAH